MVVAADRVETSLPLSGQWHQLHAPSLNPGTAHRTDHLCCGQSSSGNRCKFIEPIARRLNQGKLTLFFSLARLRQRQPIVFPLPFGFYLQKISINRLYAVIPFHSLGLGPACR